MFSNAPVICKEAEQVVVFDGGSLLHLSLREKNFRSTSIVIDEYPDNLTIVGKPTNALWDAISRQPVHF